MIRAEKEGVASESYLLVHDGGGKLIRRVLLRRDNYAVVRGLRQVKKQEETETPETQDNNSDQEE